MMENETNALEQQPGVVTPDDISNMTTQQFNEYMERLDEPETPNFDIAEEVEDATGETQETEPTEMEETAEPEPTEPETAAEPQPQPYRTFETEQDYNSEMQRRINEAVENDRRTRESDATYRRLSDTARLYYKDADDPLKAMADDMDKRAAELEGLSPDEYTKRRDDARDAKAYRDMQSRQTEQERMKQQLVSRWNTEAAAVKTLFPEFDFRAAAQDAAFRKTLGEGKSVAEAYKAMRDRLAKETPAAKRTPVPQNLQSRRSGTGEGSRNPAALPTADFMRYINNIRQS